VRVESPYKGLDAFGDSDTDALLFFGREREREIVVANLIAARLTILYGPTGVGKSSLLRAGVSRALRELSEQPLVVVFDRWRGDPSADLASEVAEVSGEPALSLVDVVERAQEARDVYLILDQAEEYFVYAEDVTSFDDDLARLVGEPLRVNVLLSLREDSLAKLDRFKPRIPFVYANSLRLDRLDREAGRAAIVRPVERWSELSGEPIAVEPKLVDAVLDGVRAGRIEPGAGGLGGIEGNGRPGTIEAPYLQLVMQRVWEVERAAGSGALRASTLAELGGARRIVADHLERAVESLTPEQRDLAGRLFTYLVTPSGTKIAHDLPDLAEYAGVTVADATPVVETLSRHRILRPDEAGRTEIFHDVLADEVLAWRRAHDAERALERERSDAQRRHRRLAWFAAAAVGAFLLMSLLTVFAFSQRSQARDEARKSKAHELEAGAAAVLDIDPELSLLLGLEAVRLTPDRNSEAALRTALLASRERAVVDVGKPLLGAVFRGPDLVLATSDGHVVVADRRSGVRRRAYATGSEAVSASFAADGTVLLTGKDDRLRLVRPRGRVAAVPGVTGARAAALSPDGTLAAVVEKSGVRLLDPASGEVLRVIARRGVVSVAISPGDGLLVTGGADDTVLLWGARTGTLLRTFPHQEKRAVAVAFSPRATLVASASTDNLARIWQVRSGNLIGVSSSHSNALTDVDFSSDGGQVVTASKDGTARVSKADGGTLLVTLSGHSDWVTSATFSGGANSSVVTASTDGTARVWDTTFQPQLHELAQFGKPVVSVEFISRHRIRAVTADRRAHIVDARSGVELGSKPAAATRPQSVACDGAKATIRGRTVILRTTNHVFTLRKHRARVLSIAFSPDCALLATGSKDHDVRLWEVATGDPLLRLPHGYKVRDAEFSPDGRWLVTAAGRAGLYDTRDGALIVRLRGHERPVASAAFDPTGKQIVTGGDDGTVRTYRCEICGGIDDLVRLARARLAITDRQFTPRERAKYLG
jgi:WD40 repeat protein